MRRHPLLAALGCIALLLLAGGVYLVTTFDLNRYRDELAAVLGEAVHRPVQLGEVRFSLRHGPALDFHDLQIGDATTDLPPIRARHLFLRLSFGDLLKGRLTAHQLIIDRPDIALVLPLPGPAPGSPAASGFDPTLLERFDIQSCTIRQGRLRILDHPSAGSATWTLQDFAASIDQLTPGRTARLKVHGQLVHQGQTADLRLAGQLKLSSQPPFWASSDYDLKLEATELPMAWARELTGPLPGRLDVQGTTQLKGHLSGRGERTLQGDLQLAGGKLVVLLADGRRRNAPFRTLRLAGSLERGPDQLALRHLQLQLDALELRGEAQLDTTPKPARLKASVSMPKLPLPAFLDWLPPGTVPGLAGLREHLNAGRLTDLSLRYDGALPSAPLAAVLSGLRGQARLSQLELVLPRIGPVRQGTCRVTFNNHRLEIADGRFTLDAGELALTGHLDLVPQGPWSQALTLSGQLEGSRLLALLPSPQDGAASAKGPVAVHLDLAGSPEHPVVDFSADLQEVAFRYGNWLNKPAGLAADLLLSGDYAKGRLTLSHGRLQLLPLDIKGNGYYELAGDQAFQFEVNLPLTELARVPERLPPLARFRPRGRLSLDCRWQGRAGRVEQRRGTLTLDGAGFRLGHPLADLNDATGQLQLKGDTLNFTGLTARLGTSPLTLSGHFVTGAEPGGTLDVQARSIRADELIFPSDQAYLRDIDAHLVLGPDRLEFAPVRTRLDGGTRAVVTGAVEHFRDPAVDLDITASYGNIDEVIALWHRADPPPQEDGGEPPPAPRLRIRARAERGSIGGMDFSEARGEISLRGRALVIQPLHCRIGPGYVVGQVVVDHDSGAPPLLRISGHAEDIEANTVYRQLLKQHSLVKGSLRGDFYLQGVPGSRFLPTSRGGFHVTVNQGVLREFKFLSKVFSLLNVSQIFSLKLPDMNREGMPFSQITGNFKLDQGILSSEDLFVESNAMNLSLVGRMNLVQKQIDAVMGVKPLRTVDKVLSKIPVAGWLLTGDEKALITAHFSIKGPTEDPEVTAIPISSVSKKVQGIFRRVLKLPGKVIEDLGGALQGGGQ